MKKLIVIVTMSLLVIGMVFSSVAFACSGTPTYYTSAERYSYPGDGDDAYAYTYALTCGDSWNNYLYSKVIISYRSNGNVVDTYGSTATENNTNVAVASDTCPSDSGAHAHGTHTFWCYNCGNPHKVLTNVATIDYY